MTGMAIGLKSGRMGIVIQQIWDFGKVAILSMKGAS